jgi:membrane protease YdiL (CAAX protease family)
VNLPGLQQTFSRAPLAIRYAVILTLIMASGALMVLGLFPLGRFDTASALTSFSLLCLPYMLFASRHFREWLRERSARNVFAFPLLLLAIYVLYAVGPGRLRVPASLVIPVYLVIPILLAVLAKWRGVGPNRYDLLTIVFLYVPIEAAALARAWRPGSADLPSPSHPFSQLMGINLALYCFTAVRPLEGIGFTFNVRGRDAWTALAAFGLFFPFALVVGVATGFVPFQPHLPDPIRIIPVTLGVTLMVALPEEILFRGVIQNLLQRTVKTTRGRILALLVASVVFGFTHLNNHPLFDWRYVTLASVAGIAYGTVYARTGKVTASAITHALVDIVWRLCF